MVDPNVIVLLVNIAAGIFGMPIIQAMKKFLKLEDKPAFALATVMSIAIGFVVAYANGIFNGMGWTLGEIEAACGVVFATAQLLYVAFLKEPTPPVLPSK
jgi:H+/Cl- antiporter ClcA